LRTITLLTSYPTFRGKIIALRRELREIVGNIPLDFVPSGLNKMVHKYELSKNLLQAFYNPEDRTYSPLKFIDVMEEVENEVRQHNVTTLIEIIEYLKSLLYSQSSALTIVRREFWRIKDDMYNIYRIRNMLVHLATTNSLLLGYYARRCREYSLSLLDEIKWKLLSTENDNEILSLENYFQNIVIEGNIGLEAIQNNDMATFRSWVLS
ncbi:MAG: hypothetical protein L0Y80_02410, partial [Ignavibacteriae bacterium]|nr:hypothetical protein [Ignavibacteriota bacterium]